MSAMVVPVVTMDLENDIVLQASICFHFWHSRVIVMNVQRWILAYPAKMQDLLFSLHIMMGVAALWNPLGPDNVDGLAWGWAVELYS